jgi:hypothetical protein
VPFGDGYHVWSDKITYDRSRDRFLLSYYAQSNMIQMTRDAYLFYRFIWPDAEPVLTVNTAKGKGTNIGLPAEKAFPIYTPGPAEMTVMISGDAGITWKLATTPDFAAAAGSAQASNRP